MPRFLRSAFISQEELFAGNWGPHLDRLLAQPSPSESPATNGAEVAVDMLLQQQEDGRSETGGPETFMSIKHEGRS